jgi:hypothetical protein
MPNYTRKPPNGWLFVLALFEKTGLYSGGKNSKMLFMSRLLSPEQGGLPDPIYRQAIGTTPPTYDKNGNELPIDLERPLPLMPQDDRKYKGAGGRARWTTGLSKSSLRYHRPDTTIEGRVRKTMENIRKKIAKMFFKVE